MSPTSPQDREAALRRVRRVRERLLRDGAVVSRADGATRRLAPLAIGPAEGQALEEVSPADGLHRWAVLRASRTADERPFDFYVEF